MLTSYPPLNYTFSNPAVAFPPLSGGDSCLQNLIEAPALESSSSPLPCLEPEPAVLDPHLEAKKFLGSELWSPPSPQTVETPKDKPTQQGTMPKILQGTIQEPEDDMKALLRNEDKLRRCGYYHGSLSWVDASHMLRCCKVGTFIVRDSEHSHYLYALSVQTRKGPTSCRLDYDRGYFRLDSAEHLADKMPRFECVTDLVEHYIELTEYLAKKDSPMAPVWLDLDEENTRDAPVQICKPLYKKVPDLQLLCCQNIVRRLRKRYPSSALSMTVVLADLEYKSLPRILQHYLNEYLFPAKIL